MTGIQFLYFKDCPNWKKALKNLNLILSEEGVNIRVQKILIRNEEDAARRKFGGSPSIRINGRDIDPSFQDSGPYPLVCRKYPGGEADGGMPPDDMIRKAVRQAFPL